MALSFGQMTYNGVQIGPGGIAQIVSVVGLGGPVSRNSDVARPNQSGMLAGFDYAGDRQITLALDVVSAQGNTGLQNLESVQAAFQYTQALAGGLNAPSSALLTYNLGQSGTSPSTPGYNRFVVVRPRKLDWTLDTSGAAGDFQTGLISVAILLDAVDPTVYDANVQQSTVGLTVATGGLTFPLSFPVTFGGSSGGFVYATNSGYAPCYPLITVLGPCSGPRIQQQTTGQYLDFGFFVGYGDELVIDTYAGSAVLNGSASRLNQLLPGSQFFSLPGNTTSTLGFYSQDGVATGATMTVAWTNAWM
jgi:Phage tail protein